MSQHSSLRVGGKIRKKRNVMKRFERLDLLRAEGRIAEDKVLGLPKTKAINWFLLSEKTEAMSASVFFFAKKYTFHLILFIFEV